MRIVYLDEAGISNPIHEPYLVVAGVIVNADQQWKLLEEKFHKLTEDYFPDWRHVGKIGFHTKDIWHGNNLFDRSRWSRDRRFELLDKLVRIPREFSLPIVIGHIAREKYRIQTLKKVPAATSAQIQTWCHSAAFVSAIQRVEKWMQEYANTEVAMLIAEDVDKTKGTIRLLHDGYTNRPFNNYDDHVFKAPHIVDGVHFARKEDALLLQIADICAFFAKRQLMRKADSAEFYRIIEPQIFHRQVWAQSLAVTVPIEHVQFIDEQTESLRLNDSGELFGASILVNIDKRV